jgi:hypothetical protein
MAEEESFDIYGDDDVTSPSSPSQSGPKKRLRRERSSSAPPLINNNEEEDDGSSTPRGKKVKEEEPDDEELDPFREYDDDVLTRVPVLFSVMWQSRGAWLGCKCTVWLMFSITMERESRPLKLHKILLYNEKLLHQNHHKRLLHYMSAISIGYAPSGSCLINSGQAMRIYVDGQQRSMSSMISRTSLFPNIK